MAMHYSELNSIQTEIITGESDPHYYPNRMGLLGFINKDVIALINNDHASKIEAEQKIILSETIAWKQCRGGMPDDFKIGDEIRLPTFYHSQISNLLIFGIKGSKRTYPLDNGIQYHEGKQYRWEKGIGYVDIIEEMEDNRKKYRSE